MQYVVLTAGREWQREIDGERGSRSRCGAEERQEEKRRKDGQKRVGAEREKRKIEM